MCVCLSVCAPTVFHPERAEKRNNHAIKPLMKDLQNDYNTDRLVAHGRFCCSINDKTNNQPKKKKEKSGVGVGWGGVKITQTSTLAIQPRQDQGRVPGHQQRRTAGCPQAETLPLDLLEVWMKKDPPRPRPCCWATALGSPRSPSCPCPSPLQTPETLLWRGLGWLRTLLRD